MTLYVGVRYELLLLIYLWLLSCSLILIFFIFELVVALSALAGLGSTNTRYEPEGYLTSTLVSVLVTAGAASKKSVRCSATERYPKVIDIVTVNASRPNVYIQYNRLNP